MGYDGRSLPPVIRRSGVAKRCTRLVADQAGAPSPHPARERPLPVGRACHDALSIRFPAHRRHSRAHQSVGIARTQSPDPARAMLRRVPAGARVVGSAADAVPGSHHQCQVAPACHPAWPCIPPRCADHAARLSIVRRARSACASSCLARSRVVPSTRPTSASVRGRSSRRP